MSAVSSSAKRPGALGAQWLALLLTLSAPLSCGTDCGLDEGCPSSIFSGLPLTLTLLEPVGTDGEYPIATPIESMGAPCPTDFDGLAVGQAFDIEGESDTEPVLGRCLRYRAELTSPRAGVMQEEAAPLSETLGLQAHLAVAERAVVSGCAGTYRLHFYAMPPSDSTAPTLEIHLRAPERGSGPPWLVYRVFEPDDAAAQCWGPVGPSYCVDGWAAAAKRSE